MTCILMVNLLRPSSLLNVTLKIKRNVGNQICVTNGVEEKIMSFENRLIQEQIDDINLRLEKLEWLLREVKKVHIENEQYLKNMLTEQVK